MTSEPALPYEAKEALYRIAQEALNNVVKHARARRVDLRLSAGMKEVVLEVRDDGVGFAAEGAAPGHLGLQSMRERAVRVGDTLDVENAAARASALASPRLPAPPAGARHI
jgi:signal transduction histidine kinase